METISKKLIICKACSWIDDNKSVYVEDGYEAWDNFPDGSRENLTAMVNVTREQIDENSFRILYNVKDRAGNPAEQKIRMVTRVVEDVHKTIEQIREVVERRLGEIEPRTRFIATIMDSASFVGTLIFWIVMLLVLIYFGPRFLNLIVISYQVNMQQRKVAFNDYVDAYEFWYAFRHPNWTKERREHVAHQTYHKRYHDT